MKLFIAKINNEKAIDPIIKNMAGYNIIDPVIINGLGMDDEIKDFNGSLLGSLRVMFEKERKKINAICVVIKDTQVEYAVKAVEDEIGDIDKSKQTNMCLAVPLDFIKGKF